MSLFSNIISTAGNVLSLVNDAGSLMNTVARKGFIDIDPSNSTTYDLQEEMFALNGLSHDKMMEHFLADSEQMEQLQYADVFHIEVIRQAPEYPLEKSRVLSMMINTVDIVTTGLNAEEVPVGSTFYNELSDPQGGEIQISFLESRNGDVLEMLTKRTITDVKMGMSVLGDIQDGISQAAGIINGINNRAGLNIPTGGLTQLSGLLGSFDAGGSAKFGDDVNPIDGTYLLPYDYFFSIKLSHLIRNNGTTIEKIIVSGDYILDGGASFGYATGDEQYLTTNATFKPIQGWRN